MEVGPVYENIFEWLPLESIVHILGYLPRVDDVFLFGKTCRHVQQAVLNYIAIKLPSKHRPDFQAIQKAAKNKKNKPKKLTFLYSEQIKGLLTLEQYPEENLFLKSPMGTGKTLLILLHAIRMWREHRVRTIIVATTKCFTTWWTHLSICGLNVVKSKPQNSDVLVIHNTCQAHRIYLLNTEVEAFKTLPYYIILTTSTYLKRPYMLNKLRALNGVYTQTIADEAHLLEANPRYYMHFFSQFERSIYLSATDFEGTLKCTPRGATRKVTKLMYTKKVTLGCCVDHPVKMEYSLIPAMRCVELQLTQMFTNRTFKHKKVILFTNWNPQHMRSHFKAISESIPQFAFLKFNNTNTRALEKFREHGKRCVLVTTILSASEGTNFEVADAAVYMNFGDREIRRARQCFGRVRRRNNPNPVVQNYILYNAGSTIQYVRTLLNVYYAVDLDLTIEKKPGSQILATAKMCTKMGIDVKTLPKPEFVTLFSINRKATEFLPFKEEEYTLPLFQMMQLMNLGVE